MKLTVPIDKQRLPMPRLEAPRCTCKDFEFLVKVQYDGVQIDSGILGSRGTRLLLEDDFCRITFNEPFVFGKAKWAFTEQERLDNESGISVRGLPVTWTDFDPSKLQTEIIVFRHLLDDAAVCAIYNSKHCTPILDEDMRLYVHPITEAGEQVTAQSKFDVNKEQTGGHLLHVESSPHVENWPLKHSHQAAEILSRLPYPIRFNVVTSFKVVDGDHYAFTNFDILAVKHCYKGDHILDRFLATSKKEAMHGVTFLHIFSELQG